MLKIQRDRSIDIAKGIGIFLVVWAHASCPVRSEINTFHMPLFFFVSGLLFNEKLVFKELLYKKYHSLLVPYFFFFVLCEGAFVLLSYLTHKMERVFISPGMLIHPWGVLGPLWFLLSLFEVTILATIIVKLIKNSFIQLLIVLFLSFFSYLLSNSDIKLPLYLDSSCSMLLFFYLGFILKKSNFVNGRIWQWYIGIVLMAIFYIGLKLGVTLISVRNVIRANYIIYLLTAVSGTMIILLLSRLIDRKGMFLAKILSYSGRNSLYIFAFHLLLFELVYSLFNIDAFTTSYDRSIYIVIFSIVMSVLFSFGLKKILPSVFS